MVGSNKEQEHTSIYGQAVICPIMHTSSYLLWAGLMIMHTSSYIMHTSVYMCVYGHALCAYSAALHNFEKSNKDDLRPEKRQTRSLVFKMSELHAIHMEAKMQVGGPQDIFRNGANRCNP
jgi:hypothetical protein